jgi:hypothetical protein
MTDPQDSALPAPPPPAGSSGAGDGAEGSAAEAAAWAEVEAGWEDPGRHRAYLARLPDLPGLAVAGGRYRAALAASPGDPVAARFLDEVLRRAVAQGLAALPRTPAGPARSRRALRAAAVVVIAGLGLAAALLAGRLHAFLGARP